MTLTFKDDPDEDEPTEVGISTTVDSKRPGQRAGDYQGPLSLQRLLRRASWSARALFRLTLPDGPYYDVRGDPPQQLRFRGNAGRR